MKIHGRSPRVADPRATPVPLSVTALIAKGSPILEFDRQFRLGLSTGSRQDARHNPMQMTMLKIQGMTCPKCAARVEKALAATPGVQRATVTLTEGARVEHNGVSVEALKQTVARAGAYTAEVAE